MTSVLHSGQTKNFAPNEGLRLPAADTTGYFSNVDVDHRKKKEKETENIFEIEKQISKKIFLWETESSVKKN